MALKNSLKASIPPAEAPIPTTIWLSETDCRFFLPVEADFLGGCFAFLGAAVVERRLFTGVLAALELAFGDAGFFAFVTIIGT